MALRRSVTTPALWTAAAGGIGIVGEVLDLEPRSTRRDTKMSEKNESRETRDDARGTLGVELPFGWCLVRGDELRRLQMQLHEAEQTAALRLRTIGNLRRELLRKESR